MLMIVFMIALGSAIVRDIPVDCGCFGSEEPSVAAAWKALARHTHFGGSGVALVD
jgi:hypothetical protein